ncbi:MAG TPA: DUF438 domain-containing protein [Spirochaetia bacterium]|nr:DUF438 domain-containing protein [Spirochaetia bacterium]
MPTIDRKADSVQPEIKERIKAVLRDIRSNDDPALSPERRAAIKHLLAHASPAMIAAAEQELVAEGFTIQDLTTACDAHLELFREAAGEQSFDLPPDHPISRFEEDHRVIFETLAALRAAIAQARDKTDRASAASDIEQITRFVDLLLAAENHNVRQENTLFPMLERYGIEQPPAIMWQEHLEMREQKKRLVAVLGETANLQELVQKLDAAAVLLSEQFAMHSQKERRILYPAAIELFSAEEWNDIRLECDSLGYFTDTPVAETERRNL